MKILGLTIENLNSLRLRKTLRFDEAPLSHTGLFAITGDTGAGKTTILDAITLGMYGRIARNKNVEEVLSWGATQALAEVEFSHAGHIYRAKWTIWRSRNKIDGKIQPPKRELSRYNPETEDFEILAEKIREMDQLLEEITGLDYDRFGRSVLLAQGDFAAFLDADERERSDLLERITGTEVYSALSKAAFERYRLEEQQLKEIDQELKGLRLLSAEQRATLEQQEQALRKEVKALAAELANLQKSLQYYQEAATLSGRLEELGAELEQLSAEEEALTPQLEQLRLSRLAHPLRAGWERWQEQAQEAQERQEKIALLQEKVAQGKQALDKAEKNYQQVADQLAAAKNEWETNAPIWTQAAALDRQIERRLEMAEERKTRLSTLKEQLDKEKKVLQVQKARQVKIEQQRKNAEAWLDQQQGLDKLEQEFSSVEWNIKSLQELDADLVRYRKVLRQLEEEHQDALRQKTALKKELDQREQKKEALQQEFSEAVRGNYPDNRTEVLQTITQDIQQLRQRQDIVQQLRQQSTTYRQQMRRLDQQDQFCERLEEESVRISTELLNLEERLEEARRRRDYAQRIYHQQQQIGNFQQARAELEPGEPCPVCLSTEHPFREHDLEPYLDEARKEMERSERRYKQVDQEWKNQLHHHQKQHAELELVRQEKEQLQQRTTELEESISELQAQVAEPQLIFAERPDALEKVLTQLTAQLAEKQALQERLSTLTRDLEIAEKAWTFCREEWQQLEARCLSLQDRITDGQGRIKEDKTKRDTLQKELNRALADMGVQKKEQPPEAILAELIERKKQAEKYREQSRSAAEAARLLAEKHRAAQERIDAWEAEQKTLVTGVKEDEQWIDEQQKKRYQLLPKGTEPEIARNTALARERQLIAEATTADQKRTSCRVVLSKREAALAEQVRELDNLQTANHTRKAELEAKAGALGFTSLEAATRVLLPPAEEKKLDAQQQALERQQAETRRLYTERQNELENLQKKIADLPAAELLQEKRDQQQAEYDHIQQQVGGIESQLTRDNDLRKEQGELSARRDAQEAEYQRWANLNELIGSADGKKFRTFAQSLTLERLSVLANHHLQQLNGRYYIRKQADTDLTLDIVDTYQANNVRSMRTLSGGERFLVSLALALGLSDLAGRHARIDSLFIDEGFGTLDEHSLDLAITTLENLQSVGKTIGIISHVKELKERIGVRIQVNKQRNGFSDWELVD